MFVNRWDIILSAVYYKLGGCILYKQANVAHCFGNITVPTCSKWNRYINQLNGNNIQLNCKVISGFLIFYNRLGNTIKEYIFMIKELTLLFLIARITLHHFSKPKPKVKKE